VSGLGYSYGLGAGETQTAQRLLASAEAQSRQADTLETQVNASGLVRVSGETYAVLAPTATGVEGIKAQARQVVAMRKKAKSLRADAERADAQAKAQAADRERLKASEARRSGGTTSQVLDTFFGRNAPQAPAPKAPSAATPRPSASTGGYVYRGPSYEPGRVLASMPPPRQSSLPPLQAPRLVRAAQVVRAPGSRFGPLMVVAGSVLLVGALAYWVIKK
jgi:hypothetical protein